MALSTVVTPIDPSSGVEGVLNAVTDGVNDNLATISAVGGGLIAVGVVWRLITRMTGRKA